MYKTYVKIASIMKLRTTTPVSKSLITRVMIFVAVFAMIVSPVQLTQKVSADKYDDQINAIQAQIDTYNVEAARLAAEADTLQAAVANIRNQAAIIQAQIDISQAQYEQLVIQIAQTEKDIADNKDALGEIIASMFVDDNITPIEMLASSKNIGDFLDKQEYQSSIRDQLTSTIAKVKQLKVELESKRIEVEKVLADQNTQKAALVAKQNEQQALLDQTQGQEAAYQQLVSKSNAEITQLRSQQIAENLARARQYGGGYTSLPGDGSRGGYPSAWMAAPLDAYVDPWGMYTRECVSYAAFKVDQAYGNMPYWGGIGNANQWDDNARNQGIPYGTTPKPGSVGVIDGGYYGHVAWVESVNSDGTINISHFNVGWSGEYFEWYNVSPGYFNYYIYFGEWY